MVVGPCPFSMTLLRGPLAHSSSDLNSISCTIVKLRLNCSGIVVEVAFLKFNFRDVDAYKSNTRDILT